MVDDDEVTERVETAIRGLCGIGADEPLTPDAPLWELGLDSLRVVELVMVIEEELDTTFPDEYLTADTFATLGSTLDVVRKISS